MRREIPKAGIIDLKESSDDHLLGDILSDINYESFSSWDVSGITRPAVIPVANQIAMGVLQ